MANESVGKISLDMEVQSDIGSQISAMAGRIGGQVEKSLKKASGGMDTEKIVQGMSQGISQEIQKLMKNITGTIDAALKRCTQAAGKGIDTIGEHLNAMIDQAMARFTNIANPFAQAEEPAETADAKAAPSQPRAPPVAKVKMPAIKADYTEQMLETQMEQIDQVMQNTGRQIDLLQQRLDGLKSQKMDLSSYESLKKELEECRARRERLYDPAIIEKEISLTEQLKTMEKTADQGDKSKLEEKIVKTEGAIISLTGKIENLGIQYDILEEKARAFEKASMPKTGMIAGMQVKVPKVNMAPKVSGVTDMTGVLDNAKVRTMASAEQINQALSLIGTGRALAGIQAVRSGVTGLLKAIGGGLVSGVKRASTMAGRLFGTIGGGVPKIMKAGSALTLFGLRAKTAGKQSQSAQSGMHRMLTTMLRYQIIIPIIMSALRGMAKSLFASMNANEQFRNSLSRIKSNLHVAFTPIYQAIMPALNALMAALARVTGYMAAFISLLFGKTVSASTAATKSLVDAKTAMGAYGSSARKAAKDAQGLTTGIDELNILKANKGDSADGGGGGEAPEITPPDIDTSQMDAISAMAEKVRNILAQLFQPMKESWDKEGQSVINAAQYAFGSIITLAQAMGKSFLGVWTNGTGELFCTNILRLVTLVLNVVGDIAGAFARAWEEGGRGTALIQSLFDALNSGLGVILAIGKSFREVWNSGTGESVIGHILEIFTNIYNTITNIGDNFRAAWNLDDTGTKLLQNLADILDNLLGYVDKITKSLSDWSSKLDFSPILTAFEGMTAALKPLGDKLGAGLEWLFTNVLEPLAKWALEQAIPVAIDAITAAFKIFNAILDVLKPMAEWLWENLLKPLAVWTGGTIVEIIQGITDVFNGLADIFTAISNGTDWGTIGKMIWDGLVNGIASFGEWAWDKIKGIFGGIVGKVKDILGIHSPSTVFEEIGSNTMKGYGEGVDNEKPNILGKLQSLTENIRDKFNEGYSSVKTAFSPIGSWFADRWNDVKNVMDGAPGWFDEKFHSARTNVTNAFQSMGEWFGERYTDVTTAFEDSPTWFSSTFKDSYKKLTAAVQPIGSWFKDRYTDVKDAFAESPSWFQTTFESAYDNLTAAVSPIGDWFGGRYTDVQNAFKDSPAWFQDTFKNVSNNVQTVFQGLTDFVTGVFTGDWKQAWNGVKDIFKDIFNNVVSLLENAMNFIISGINKVLNGLNKVADAVGDVIGLDLEIPKLKEISLPRLAQGGYIGADQPRLAMIGDNRHHGEIVAPEDKMQAMVDKAVAMASRPESMSEQYLMVMIELLKKIIELIENLDLVVNIDIREIRQKLKDLKKRSGFTFT